MHTLMIYKDKVKSFKDSPWILQDSTRILPFHEDRRYDHRESPCASLETGMIAIIPPSDV